MSSKNSKVEQGSSTSSETKNITNLSTKVSTDGKPQKKLVKFNLQNVKIVEDPIESKPNSLELNCESTDSVLLSKNPDDFKESGPSTVLSTNKSRKERDGVKSKSDNSFTAKRRNHYKNEFTASKTSKQSESAD